MTFVKPTLVYELSDARGKRVFVTDVVSAHGEVKRQMVELGPEEAMILTAPSGEQVIYTAEEAEDLLDELEKHL